MIEDMDKAYIEQETKLMELILERLVVGFKQGNITIEEFSENVMEVFSSSLNCFAPYPPDAFENGEVEDPVAYFEEQKKKFREAKTETEKCIIHDTLQYAISRMDITEIQRSGIYDK